MEELQVLVDVHKHQFSLVDAERPPDFDGWDNDWTLVGVGVTDQMLTVFTARADGPVPLTVRVTERAPTLEERRWSGLVDAGLVCRSGRLAVDSLVADRASAPTLDVAPVPHRSLVGFGDTDSARYDGREGADHYLIVLWPAAPFVPVARKKHLSLERARLAPRLDPRLELADALALLQSDEAHDRFHATAELARHGTPAALRALMDAADTPVARHQATQSLALARPLPLDALEHFSRDTDERVRAAAVTVLHDVLFEVELGDPLPLDVDRCYALLKPRLDDVQLPRMAAEAALRELDACSDDLRELGQAEGESGSPGQSSELEQAAAAYVARLLEAEILEVTAAFDAGRAAEAVVEIVGTEHARSGLGAALAEALFEVPGVDEVYASDDELEALLRPA